MAYDINGLVLEPQEFENLGDIFGNCFDLEMAKLSEAEETMVLNFALDCFLRKKLHTLFTPGGVAGTTMQVFENETIRDFVLCLTDRLGIQAGLNSLGNFVVERSLARGIGQPDVVYDESGKRKSDDDGIVVFIPERVLDNIELTADKIMDILQINKWLTVVCLINLFMYKTELFNEEKTKQIIKDGLTPVDSPTLAS